MKKNVPRLLAWFLLMGAAIGAPIATRLGYSIPPGVLRWLLTAGTALMILSFFWFPRRCGTNDGKPASPGRFTRRDGSS